jgi:putative transposase
VFSSGAGSGKTEQDLTAPLYQEIGRLKMEVDWLKKALNAPLEDKRRWIEPDHASLSVARQCELAGLSRSSHYCPPRAGESPENLELMRQIDQLYLERPFYGSPRMTRWLRELGWAVNEKRVARLMRQMGLQAVLPGPHTSRPCPEHRVYPYLLRGLAIESVNQVWGADITYVPLQRGYLYLVAVMDWYSRYVLAWELSNTLETLFCLDALEQALSRSRPGIFNTDQGVQFTSDVFTGRLESAGVAISMDGRGRAMDNVFVERLWRTVKYEEVYLKDYADGQEAREELGRYFRFYNTERPHQSLDYHTPEAVYSRGR